MQKFLYTLTASLILTLLFASCNSDDDLVINDLVGTWYGTRTYYNPASGTKYQYVTIEFEANGTGSLEYEAPSTYSVAEFVYSVNNNTVTCRGAYVNSNGDVDSDFEMNLRIDDDRLIPLDRYNMFILTKDNSVMTDGDGNEFIDDSELIEGVWLHSSREVVLVINGSDYTKYTLPSTSSNIYSYKTEGWFSYQILQKYVLLDGVKYDVLALSANTLQLRSSNGTNFSYTRGTVADIPTNGENSTNYQEILESPTFGWKTSNGTYIISFSNSGSVFHIETSSKKLGSYGYINLDAQGTYSLSGKTITCTFTDVWWQSGNSSAKDFFPGWSYGNTNIRIYTIESINVEIMVLTCDGKRYTYYNSNFY